MNHPPVIVGLGEILWDVYPDEARFGGAPANFAIQAESLGGESWMVSAVGTDDFGARALARLAERSVRCDTVTRDAAHPTGSVAVNLDPWGKATYEFAHNAAWDHLVWSDETARLAARCDAVCFGTLGQRNASSRTTIRRFLQSTRPEALRIFDVNLRQQFYDAETILTSLRLASVVKLNDEELPVVARICGLSDFSPRAQLVELVARFDLKVAALTCGANGSLLAADSGINECPAHATELVDTVGAGDAFTATLALGLIRSLPLAEINRRANAVAAFVCSQRGASPVLPAELTQPILQPLDT